ncbi:MAG TPA: GatB/YqeY domain-containing protein, partial [Bacillota bacterium]|nr:GatB/YqeY domain-containing protein [Bacillota bacterium]
MTLKDRLLSDMRTAMKQKDTVRKTVLSMARAAILQLEKDKRTELDDQGVMEVIAKEIKSRKEALEMFKQGGRQDLV